MKPHLLEPEVVHSDSRRTLTQLFTADVKQVNLYEVNPNVTLGDHYHKQTVEYFYVLDGELEVNGHDMKPGDLFVFYPETTHTVHSKTASRFMTFLTVPYNGDSPDLWKG